MKKFFITEEDINLILSRMDEVKVKDYKVIIQILQSKPMEEEKLKK